MRWRRRKASSALWNLAEFLFSLAEDTTLMQKMKIWEMDLLNFILSQWPKKRFLQIRHIWNQTQLSVYYLKIVWHQAMMLLDFLAMTFTIFFMHWETFLTEVIINLIASVQNVEKSLVRKLILKRLTGKKFQKK